MLGENIRKLRESQNKGVNELARAADINASYLSSIERGIKNNPSIETLEKIAKALDVSLHELLDGDEEAARNFASETVSTGKTPDETFIRELREGETPEQNSPSNIQELAGYLRVSKEALKRGITPKDLEHAIDFIERARKRVEEERKNRDEKE